jgi:hypothetical protein
MKLPLIIHRPLKKIKDIWRYKFKHKIVLNHDTEYLKLFNGNNNNETLGAFPNSINKRVDMIRGW